jgi:hypothetical protein
MDSKSGFVPGSDMGAFYTNITLKGPEGHAVLDVLRKNHRRAYVFQGQASFTVVFEAEIEGQDEKLLCRLTRLLSLELECPALGVLNHDDDLLIYYLYSRGQEKDRYNSTPGTFTGVDKPPAGGKAALLIEAFELNCKPERVADILHSQLSISEDLKSAQQSLVAGMEEWAAKIYTDPNLLAQLLTGRLSSEALVEIEKMRDETFAKTQPLISRAESSSSTNKYIFAMDRHHDLVQALGLPSEAVGWGYHSIENGEYPGELGVDDFVHT